MIRAFTISFDYEGKTYIALASIRSTHSDGTSYSIRLFDEKLWKIVPGGVLSICPGEEKTSQSTPSAKQLSECICQSVNEHLQVCEHA